MNGKAKTENRLRFYCLRTRWFQLKLHLYFEGKQCWRLNIKGDPEWEGFGNASRKEFENI